MFTCLCSRAIHKEVAQSLETDSFILSLRRFIGRRGNICQMRSDNGINTVGAIKEFRKSFKRWIIMKSHSIYKDTEAIG